MNYIIAGIAFGLAMVALVLSDQVLAYVAGSLLVLSFFFPDSLDNTHR